MHLPWQALYYRHGYYKELQISLLFTFPIFSILVGKTMKQYYLVSQVCINGIIFIRAMNSRFECQCCGTFTKACLRCTISLAHFIISLYTFVWWKITGICFLHSIIYLILFIFKEIAIQLEKNLPSLKLLSYTKEKDSYKYLFQTRNSTFC